MFKNKSTLILILACIFSSIAVIVLFVTFFNIFSQTQPTSEELLALELSNANETEIITSEDGGLANFIIPPKLKYFQFMASFSANMKNDSNIMNTEIALSTFEGDYYFERLKHHEPALRKIILDTIADFEESLIRSKKGKQELAETLLQEIQNKLVALGEEPKIKEVHFSSFAIR